MTIKKQFVILSSIIVSVPIICLLTFILFSYARSSKRLIINGSKKLEDIFPGSGNPNLIEKEIKQLPPDMEFTVYLQEEDKVVMSTIPEIPVRDNFSKDSLWFVINKTSEDYFYQFSTSHFPHKQTLIISRIPRKERGNKNNFIYQFIFLILILTTIISLFLIVLISRTIFKSIMKIDQKTQQLADGKLNQTVLPEPEERTGNEITSILNSLETMRKELIEVQDRKNRFVMGISHDLRTPVAVIKGYSEAIIDGVISDKEEITNTVSLIESKATLLGDMIDTLINFMKLNCTEVKEKLVSDSITDLIIEFAKYAEVTGTVFKRKVTTNINLPEKILIPLNSQLVHRSFENLLGNAIRYTNENDEINIEAFTQNTESTKEIVLKIRDHGIGIDKKDLDSIFDMFFRGTNSRKEEGMGIGLSVVKSIMDTHGWTISVESEKSKGTCFTIIIPY